MVSVFWWILTWTSTIPGKTFFALLLLKAWPLALFVLGPIKVNLKKREIIKARHLLAVSITNPFVYNPYKLNIYFKLI